MNAEPSQSRFQASGASINYFEWGNPADPVILLVHATGFHARIWDQTVAALPDGYRVIAVDMRGHGQSEKTGKMTNWRDPAMDVLELAEHLDLKNIIAAGHSMGGHCLVQIAAESQTRFQKLVLIDPVIVPPERYANPINYGTAETHPVARRRDNWASWQEMEAFYKNRLPYSVWRAQVFADYCRYGLVFDPAENIYHLACPPLTEASIYIGGVTANIIGLVPGITVPVTVLRAKERAPTNAPVMDFLSSPTWPALAANFPNGRDVYLPELSHFIPMQDPELTARYIIA